MDYRDELDRILGARRLQPLFQPIVSLRARRIMGYEGLIRGPSDSPLHAPAPLFEAARRSGQLFELDLLCRQVLIKAFVRRGLQGRLFLNVNPLAMGDPRAVQGETLKALHRMGLSPEQVVIELTEQQPIDDYDLMRRAVAHYRRMGFSIALDDLGAGYSSFRHWSELKPDFVKIDMHFVQNAHNDPAKREFIRSFREISHTLGARLIAEGIEVHEEFEIIRGLDVEYGQGYYFGRPNADPPRSLDEIMDATQMDAAPRRSFLGESAASLVKPSPCIPPDLSLGEVVERLQRNAQLRSLPVVDDGRPVGLVRRDQLLMLYSQRFTRELHERSRIRYFMQREPLIVAQSMPLEVLSQTITSGTATNGQSAGGLANVVDEDFIIVDDGGRYLGIGTLIDLLRRITVLQVNYARYANPLTQLPGNVPINEHLDRLLGERRDFVLAYCDLDNFKPYNDRYGYARGDEVIRELGRLLVEAVDHGSDFVGHVGGDDFVLVLTRPQWLAQCRWLLDAFAARVPDFYDEADRNAGGIRSEDRRGQAAFFPFLSLSIGAVPVTPERFRSHLELSAAASEVKHQAKLMEGNSLFVDRRQSGEPASDKDRDDMSEGAFLEPAILAG